MKNSKNPTVISSTLKTVASENLVTEDEILNAKDKPLEEILDAEKQNETNQNYQTNKQSSEISSQSN